MKAAVVVANERCTVSGNRRTKGDQEEPLRSKSDIPVSVDLTSRVS